MKKYLLLGLIFGLVGTLSWFYPSDESRDLIIYYSTGGIVVGIILGLIIGAIFSSISNNTKKRDVFFLIITSLIIIVASYFWGPVVGYIIYFALGGGLS